MKNILRLLCAVLALVIVLPAPLQARASDTAALEQVIIDSCIYGEKADISQYALTQEALGDLYRDLQSSGCLPWYAETTFRYYYDESTGLVLEFEPALLSQTDYDRTLYEQAVAQVLDECVLEGMESWQIALSIHDWLVANTVYDETLTLRTGYDLLIDGSTVCSGYAALYQDLLNRVGIPCVSVTSEPMEHVWNLVCIDDRWYHVDVTWDDPSPDTYGLVSHDFFLLTDEEISVGEDPHYDWVTDITCTDTRFSDAFWRDVYSRICFSDSQTGYLIREHDFANYVYARDWTTGKETAIYTEEMPYVDIGQGTYAYTRLGLSLWNGRLYLCTLEQVLSMLPDGSDIRTEYRYDAGDHGRFLAGCFVTEDTAYLSLSDHDGNTVQTTAKLPDTGFHVHSYAQTVQAPTCLEPGYTVSVCDCGMTCQSLPTAATGHIWQQRSAKNATFFSTGFSEEECTQCAQSTSRELPQLELGTWLLQNRTLIIVAVCCIGATLCAIFRKRKAV